MEQEIGTNIVNLEELKKESSNKRKIASRLNPLKHGRYSKYFNPKVTEFIKNPQILAGLMMEAIDKLKDEDLSPKDRTLYLNVLTNVHRTIFGNKALNVNIDIPLTHAPLIQKLREQYETNEK